MAKAKDINSPEEVTALISKLEPNMAVLVNKIREVVLAADTEIGEQIKWNSPSFFYTGAMQPFDLKEYKRDILVINLSRGYPLLVFPTGAKITKATAILENQQKDGRCFVTLKTEKDLDTKTNELQKVLKEWLSLVEK
jgi:hypothetical protein